MKGYAESRQRVLQLRNVGCFFCKKQRKEECMYNKFWDYLLNNDPERCIWKPEKVCMHARHGMRR